METELDQVERALTRLSGRLASRSEDQRWYGVNCAIHVLRAVRDNQDVDAAIDRIVSAPPKAGRRT